MKLLHVSNPRVRRWQVSDRIADSSLLRKPLAFLKKGEPRKARWRMTLPALPSRLTGLNRCSTSVAWRFSPPSRSYASSAIWHTESFFEPLFWAFNARREGGMSFLGSTSSHTSSLSKNDGESLNCGNALCERSWGRHLNERFASVYTKRVEKEAVQTPEAAIRSSASAKGRIKARTSSGPKGERSPSNSAINRPRGCSLIKKSLDRSQTISITFKKLGFRTR